MLMIRLLRFLREEYDDWDDEDEAVRVELQSETAM